MNPFNLIPTGWRVALICMAVAMFSTWIYYKGWAAGSADVRLKLDEAIISQRAANDELEKAWNAHVIEAQNERTKHEKELAIARAAAAAANDRLRVSTDGLWHGLSNASADASRAAAISAAVLLSECSGKYRELAAAADGHVADVRQLEDAWPK